MDIVQRLRASHKTVEEAIALFADAADEIVRLRRLVIMHEQADRIPRTPR